MNQTMNTVEDESEADADASVDIYFSQKAPASAAQTQAKQPKGKKAGRRFKAGLAKVGTALQKINLAKLIDEMEQDQELADHLEVINKDTEEEAQRKDLVREAFAKCQAEIEQHLQDFLAQRPDGFYEDWIQDLHPDNVTEEKTSTDGITNKHIDMRFYLVDSDHRMLWNQTVDDTRQVEARTYEEMGQGRHKQAQSPNGLSTVDLLDDSGTSTR